MARMVIFKYATEDSFAAALAVWLGNQIDSDFDTDDAIYKVIYDKP